MLTHIVQCQYTSVALNAQGAVTAQITHHTHQYSDDLGQGVILSLVAVPGGTFDMGSPTSTYADEQPRHRVTVAPFWLGQYPVTQAQWRLIMGRNPSRFQGEQRPVDSVTWREAVRFCERLSQRTGRRYQLPSEAQWEYACRAGTTTAFHVGPTISTDVANYNGEFVYRTGPQGIYRHVTTAVGSFPPNAFGLYDMHGNVWEWCADVWHPSYEGAPSDDRVWQLGGAAGDRVARGGCWHDTPDVCRSAARLHYPADEGDEFFGFRVALLAPPP